MLKKYVMQIDFGFILLLVIISFFYIGNSEREISKNTDENHFVEKEESSEPEGRAEYFFRMLRDPRTNSIPPSIRQRELEFAKKLDESSSLLKKVNTANLNWKEAGPNDVGGRTRALAVDVADPNTVIAGGASGGIWKSTDNGVSWSLKSSPSTILSVTSLVQDPRSGFTNIWYYSTGELRGNSGADLGYTAYFSGNGIYKSTDNGDTWNVLPNTYRSNVAVYNSPFDYSLKIIVNPVNGTVFLASDNFGIFRSTDTGNSFSLSLGGINQHRYSDIAAASNGNLIAVISDPGDTTTPTNLPGVYTSTDNGDYWNNITPNNYPQSSARGVLDVAPSNPDIAYLLLFTGNNINENLEDIRFYKFNISTGTSEDRSGNLPAFGRSGGTLNSQNSYDMAVAVKPDDENFVLIAGTSLFRSTDGFATQSSDSIQTWIGGYSPFSFEYPNFHPDVHSYAFDPTNPDKMWWGTDGGLSYTTDIANTNYVQNFPWENKNNGYNVTQFYTITIPDIAGDNRIMGGTQDNGTPFFTSDGSNTSSSTDVSSGDGAYAYFGKDFAYTSYYLGNVFRLGYGAQGKPDFNKWSSIKPAGASNQLFIDPFAVDPTNEDVMYYAAGNVLWRNNSLSTIPNFVQDSTSVGWTKLDNFTVSGGYLISTLAVSKTPANILYYAASSYTDVPKVFKLTNSTTATSGAVDISVPSAQAGSYVHNIAVNPDDADEIMVVMSNYNIIGLYHSGNGGQSYDAVEGNLQGDSLNPGPSLRCASILPGNNGSTYFIATSIGLFSTSSFNGNNTSWTQEGEGVTGNVIVDYVVSRKSDGRVVAGTHGRGAFIGLPGAVAVKNNLADVGKYDLEQNFPNPFNPSTTIKWSIAKAGNVKLKIFDITGREIASLVNGFENAGNHVTIFNTQTIRNSLASGVYIYRLESGGFNESKKFVLLK